ncbi:MAG: response regulator [Flavisolibacter sp.]
MAGLYYLYAEDDVEDIDLFQEVMEGRKRSDRLVCVNTGVDLFQYLQQVKKHEPFPCLIILDMHLPFLNGLEILQLLKTDDLYRLIPVVIFTSGLSDEAANSCRKLGAEILHKPSCSDDWDGILSYFSSFADE